MNKTVEQQEREWIAILKQHLDKLQVDDLDILLDQLGAFSQDLDGIKMNLGYRQDIRRRSEIKSILQGQYNKGFRFDNIVVDKFGFEVRDNTIIDEDLADEDPF